MIKRRLDRLVTFHVDSKLLNRLDAFAEKREWKRNFIIREAIKFYLGAKEKENQE